jgi:hypothetical protein
MSDANTITIGFGNTAGETDALARLLESAPAGAFVEIGKRLEGGDTLLTLKLHIPGRGAVATPPLRLTTNEGAPIAYATALALLSAELETLESKFVRVRKIA